MDSIEIENKLSDIFYKVVDIDFKQNIHLREKILFSLDLMLDPRDLVIILINIQNTFEIKIPEKVLIDRKFSTFNSILRIIEESLLSLAEIHN